MTGLVLGLVVAGAGVGTGQFPALVQDICPLPRTEASGSPWGNCAQHDGFWRFERFVSVGIFACGAPATRTATPPMGVDFSNGVLLTFGY